MSVTTKAQAPPRSPPTPRASRPATSYVPLVGRITADESVEDGSPLPRQLVGDGELFVLKVVGDVLIKAANCEGDWTTVRRQPFAENGGIVAATLDREATIDRDPLSVLQHGAS
jgi:repressor LexA